MRTTTVEEGFELLTRAEAWALLAAGDVGRIGLSMRAMPMIFPVHYTVVDGCIVFRTAPSSEISTAAAGSVIAFAVDDYEQPNPTGWSVLAVGQSEVAAGSDLVRLRPELVSGRRIVRPE